MTKPEKRAMLRVLRERARGARMEHDIRRVMMSPLPERYRWMRLLWSKHGLYVGTVIEGLITAKTWRDQR